MKNIVKLLLLNLLITSALFSKDLEKVTLQFQWLDQFQFAGYYMAKEKGFYKDVGLDVKFKKYNNSIKPIEEVMKKRATYGIGRSSLIVDKSNGNNIKLLAAIFQSSPLILLATKKSGIKTIKDFKGKRIMNTFDSIEAVSYNTMMSKYNISINDMKTLKHSFDINDLIDEKTDLMASYISNEPFLLKKKGVEYKIFDPKNYGFDFYSDILFTSQDEIDNHRQRAINFTVASINGWKYAFLHIDETVELIMKKYNSQNKSKKALIYEGKKLKELAYYRTQNLGLIDKYKLQKIYDMYNVMGFIKKTIKIDDLILDEELKKINLNKEERAYLDNHKVLKVDNEKDLKPFNYNENGEVKGFSVDYMNLLAHKLDVKIKYISGPRWSDFIDMIQTPKLDIISNIVKTKKREEKILFTDKFYTLLNAIYINKKNKNIHTLNDLKYKTIAIEKDFYMQEFLAKNYPKIKQIVVYKQVEALNLLSLGKVDAVVGEKIILDNIIQNLGIVDVIPISFVKDLGASIDLRLGVSKKDKILRDILQKAKDSVTKNEMKNLKQKWFGFNNLTLEKSINLTQKEKKHLEELKEIKMCVDPSWMPFEAIENGTHVGISADYFKIFQKQISIPISLVVTKDWIESLKFAKQRKCDILSFAMETIERKKYMNFTPTYFETPLVLVTKKNVPFITNFNQLDKQKIGMPKGYALFEVLRKKYPNLNIVEVKNIDDGLDKVASGKIFAYIGSSISVGYKLKTQYIGEFQISGKFDEKWKLSVGVRNDDVMLLNIFKKIVNNLRQEQKNKILNSWTFEVKKVEDYTLALQILLIFIIVTLLFLYIYLKLKKYNEKLKESNQIIKEKESSLALLNATLADKIKIATSELEKAQKISKIGSWKVIRKNKEVICSDETYKIFGFKKQKVFLKPKDFLNKIDTNEVDRVMKVLKNHLVDKKPYLISYKILLEDGTFKYIEERGETLFENDTPLETFGTIQDITQQRLNTIAIKEKDEQLFAQSRLAQMGEMLNMIAHQWRQPLTAIGATTSSLKFSIMFDSIDVKKFEKELTLIETFTEHLSETIEDFRNFFKESKEKKLVTLESIIDETLSIVIASIKNKNIRIIKNFNCNKELVTYSSELKQVILNIVKNAEDALLECDIDDKIIEINTFSFGKEMVITIKDNAGGIPNEIIENIFDPYFSTKKEKDGTGLGLYMSRTIVEKHCAGYLNVSNGKNGAIFMIGLRSIDEE